MRSDSRVVWGAERSDGDIGEWNDGRSGGTVGLGYSAAGPGVFQGKRCQPLLYDSPGTLERGTR